MEEQHKCDNIDKIQFIMEKIKWLEQKYNDLSSLIFLHDKTIGIIEEKLNNITEKIDSIGNKIDKLALKQEAYESRPAENQNKIIIGVVSSIITGITMFVILKVLNL